ncbi:dTDP-4-dehydrorhamnose reductase family protein [Clostridium tetani]|uniref:dTDP-4-dehydrorhamnose reductase family protein n=1 Tax=Clostridium tetani TaxID=1513 RepID=UPI000512C08B|nr:SDR family oxidoreductase [Clostridium tetani]KGI39720.1 hypothetical protein LA33_03205 [Clostridium tetani ATCC 9441]RXM74403.1 SDR family NAD(P)-dependent oxidoreductase [Clostridium tetani]SUY66798.1 dTDP-4-dehydrorhamnose reductase [Clostridium tetani]
MNNKRVLITGSTGMLGKSVVKILKQEKGFDIYGISRNISKEDDYYRKISIDLTNSNLLRNTIEGIKPNIIIHCAANVDVDNCESNKEYTYNLHVNSTKILASYNSTDTKFIYVSTDSVFDGKSGNYNEEDRVNPLNYYAKTKLEGEKVAIEHNPNTVVIRTNIYGVHSLKGKSLAEWAIEKLSDNNNINGFTDVYFNPVYVGQLARVIKGLCKEVDYNGMLNVGSDKYISKHEFLKELAKVFNYPNKLIGQSSIEEVKFSGLRPKNTTLNTEKLRSLYSKVPNLVLGLEEMKKDFIKGCTYE